jgi:chromosome segregation ATPase
MAAAIRPASIRRRRASSAATRHNPDATITATPPAGVHTAAGRLRTVAALRRKRGIFGDVRYVATAMFGARSARRELVELEAKQQLRQHERRRHLITLGRTAVIGDGFDHPALGPARDQLGSVEDERSRHTGQVAAADQELARVSRDREAHAKQFAIDLAAVDAELAELAKRYEPLIKEQATVTKRGAELRESLRRIDGKIAETTALFVSVKSPRLDPAAIQAELATLKADRVAVQRDEPVIAAELDALNPRIAAIEAKRGESQRRRTELLAAEDNDQRRTAELLEAIGAKRKVMDRAANDAETLRDKILFELGERLNVDRPETLAAQLAPLDAIEVELGTVDRRMMELREILSSIDRAKLARGIAVIVLTLAVVGAFTWWLLSTMS